MAQKHYTIDADKQIVYAVMELMNDKDLKLAKKYIALGYSLVPVAKEKPKKRTAAEKEAAEKKKLEEQKANPFSEKNIQKFLDKSGTEEQKAKYWELYNEQAKDKNGVPVVYKTTAKDGRFKEGEPKKKGHIATLAWFKGQFPDYGK